MIRTAVTVILMLFLSVTYGQKFHGYLVTKGNDTINCRFFVQTNPFDDNLLSVETIRDKIKVLSNKGARLQYKADAVKSFIIEGTKFGDLKFVSLKYDGFKRFYHEVTAGRITYYRFYKGPPAIGISFAVKDDSFIELQGRKVRQVLGDMIIDYPELHAKWMDPDIYKLSQLEEVITLYNKHFNS